MRAANRLSLLVITTAAAVACAPKSQVAQRDSLSYDLQDAALPPVNRLVCENMPGAPFPQTRPDPLLDTELRNRTWSDWCSAEADPLSSLDNAERIGVRMIKTALGRALPKGTVATCENTSALLKRSSPWSLTLYVQDGFPGGVVTDNTPVSLHALLSFGAAPGSTALRANISTLNLRGKGNRTNITDIREIGALSDLVALSAKDISLGENTEDKSLGCLKPKWSADLSALGQLTKLADLDLTCSNRSGIPAVQAADTPASVMDWSFLSGMKALGLDVAEGKYINVRVNNCSVVADNGTHLLEQLSHRTGLNAKGRALAINGLQLWYSGMNTSDLAWFSEANFPALKRLDIGGNPTALTENGAIPYAPLKLDHSQLPRHNTLTYLGLSENTPSTADLISLQGGNNLTTLELHKLPSGTDLLQLSPSAFSALGTKALKLYNSPAWCSGSTPKAGTSIPCPAGFVCSCAF